MWFSLIKTWSYRPNLWLNAPPNWTAYFCATLKPGIVFLVSNSLVLYLLIFDDNKFAIVAVAERVCKKFIAILSPFKRAL